MNGKILIIHYIFFVRININELPFKTTNIVEKVI